jgi:hypothetical protein
LGEKIKKNPPKFSQEAKKSRFFKPHKNKQSFATMIVVIMWTYQLVLADEEIPCEYIFMKKVFLQRLL